MPDFPDVAADAGANVGAVVVAMRWVSPGLLEGHQVGDDVGDLPVVESDLVDSLDGRIGVVLAQTERRHDRAGLHARSVLDPAGEARGVGGIEAAGERGAGGGVGEGWASGGGDRKGEG